MDEVDYTVEVGDPLPVGSRASRTTCPIGDQVGVPDPSRRRAPRPTPLDCAFVSICETSIFFRRGQNDGVQCAVEAASGVPD
ncbi:MAG TPA: hypothetical protein VIL51_10060 [Thermoleophilia bacterium]